MTINETAMYCKMMSDECVLFVIVSLIKNKMMTDKQIKKAYGKNIPDKIFANLIYHQIIKVSRYGVFSLDEGVDNMAFILSNIDIDAVDPETPPDIVEGEVTYGYYIDKMQDIVYAVKGKDGHIMSKHILKVDAIKKLRHAVAMHRKKNKRPNSKMRRKLTNINY